MDKQLHIEQLLGHIGQKAGTVLGQQFERRLELFLDVADPMRRHPALRLCTAFDRMGDVRAALFVDGNAVAARDEADDLIAGQRVAAARELNQAVIHAVDHDAARRAVVRRLAGGRFLAGLGAVGLIVGLLDAGHHLPKLDAAVTDSRVDVVGGRTVLLGAQAQQKGFELRILHGDAVAAEFAVELIFALDDIFVALLLFKPVADLVARFARLDNFQPVAARAMGLFARDDFDDLAGLEHGGDRHHAAVDLRADHAVADGGMDGVGEVDDRCADGEVDDLAFGRKDIDLFGGQVRLDGADEVGRVLGIALVLEDLAHPHQALFHRILAGLAVLHAELIFPVRGDAVFGRVVHFPGADLNLKGDAVFADYGRVQGLVHIRLRRRNIVLKPVRQRLIHIVDDAQHVIAVVDRIDNHAHGVDIVNLVHALALDEHFPVNAVNALDAAGDVDVRDHLGDARLEGFAGAVDKRIALVAAKRQVIFDLLVRIGVEIAQGEILQFLFDGADAEAVRNGRIDLHALHRLFALFGRRPEFTGAHIVQAVGELNDDDADVLAHRDEHFADILGLLLLARGIRDSAHLCDAVDKAGNLGAKHLAQLVQIDLCILHDIVQKPRTHAFRVHAQLHKDTGDRDRMGDIWGAG